MDGLLGEVLHYLEDNTWFARWAKGKYLVDNCKYMFVAQSLMFLKHSDICCLTLCVSMDCSTPDLPVILASWKQSCTMGHFIEDFACEREGESEKFKVDCKIKLAGVCVGIRIGETWGRKFEITRERAGAKSQRIPGKNSIWFSVGLEL